MHLRIVRVSQKLDEQDSIAVMDCYVVTKSAFDCFDLTFHLASGLRVAWYRRDVLCIEVVTERFEEHTH